MKSMYLHAVGFTYPSSGLGGRGGGASPSDKATIEA